MSKPPVGSILQEFENEFHGEIVRWVEKKLPKVPQLEILDLSIDQSYFSTVVAEKVHANRLVIGKWCETQKIPTKPNVHVQEISLDPANGYGLKDFAKFDVVILRETLHKVQSNLKGFLEALRSHLKDIESQIVILARPKNPPVPLPDSGIAWWRKTALTREDVLIASADLVMPKCRAGFSHDCYAVSCPVKIPKAAWGAYLRGRHLAALYENTLCSDREIDEFIKNKPSPIFEFEEKILIYVLYQKAQRAESEEES